MRITQERLKKLIKEEFGRMSEEEGIPGAPPESTEEPAAGRVDVAATLKQVKQTLIAGAAAEDSYVVELLGAVTALVVGTNIATDTIALRALGLLKDRAAKLPTTKPG
tara:strand:- start:92 stop:415 length:324 start_codon:yes stop_codon:yes gene_type:complete